MTVFVVGGYESKKGSFVKPQLEMYRAQKLIDETVFVIDYHEEKQSRFNDLNSISGYIKQQIKESNEKDNTVIIIAHSVPYGFFNFNSFIPTKNYKDIFSILPRDGIGVIIFSSCYSGNAVEEDTLRTAPSGTVVIPTSSTTSVSNGNFAFSFSQENAGITKAADFYLEILDNFDPKQYHDDIIYNPFHWLDDSNPMNALPKVIGIAGNPPIIINMEGKNGYVAKLANTKIDATVWQHAIDTVKIRFDRVNYRCDYDKAIREFTADVCNNADTALSMYKSDDELKSAIDNVAQKIRTGQGWLEVGKEFTDKDGVKRPATEIDVAEEMRIKYAIGFSYMDKSGELDAMIQKQIDPNWLAGKTISKDTLEKLQKSSLLAGFDGQDGSSWNDKIEISEIHAVFRKHGIKVQEQKIDTNNDGILENCEIVKALSATVQKSKNPIANYFGF